MQVIATIVSHVRSSLEELCWYEDFIGAGKLHCYAATGTDWYPDTGNVMGDQD